MNRYRKQNEYYRKSKELQHINLGVCRIEISLKNKEVQEDLYKKAQFFKRLNKALDRR